MKDYFWDIKISDLLNNPWNTDNLEFKDRFLNYESYKIKISWNIFLQSLNHFEILLEIKINFKVEYECDICLKKYSESFKIFDENIKFTDPDKMKSDENIYDNQFPIDIKNQTINIKNLLEILVKNQEPIIKNCWKHKKNDNNDKYENETKKSYYKIDFSKMLKS